MATSEAPRAERIPLGAASGKPLRMIINTRLSELRDEDPEKVKAEILANSSNGEVSMADQERQCRDLLHRIGLKLGRPVVVVAVHPEPGISAYKKKRTLLPDGTYGYRVYRPGLRDTLRMLQNKGADGAVWVDLDRAFRDPRDLEDLIDIVQYTKPRPIIDSVTGSLRLETDADITMARVMVAIANKSSMDTARRVSAARLRQAMNGKWGGGGRRAFGFEDDGVTRREDEIEILVDCARKVVKGISLKALCRDLDAQGVQPVAAQRWRPEVLRQCLLNPRNVGKLIHQGEIVGAAPWKPPFRPELHQAVMRVLTDPARVKNPGRPARWLLSGLARCGVCGEGLRLQIRRNPGKSFRERGWKVAPTRRYICPKNHVARGAERLEDYIVKVVLGKVSKEGEKLLLPAAPEVDTAALLIEEEAVRARLDEVNADRDTLIEVGGQMVPLIDRQEWLTRRAPLQARLMDIRAELAAAGSASVGSPLESLVRAKDPAAAWAKMPLGSRRDVIAEIMTVTVNPAGRGRGFDPACVELGPPKAADRG